MTKTVEQLLIEHKIAYVSSGKDFVTTCFNPNHNDTNPSFRIDRFTGISHCFSCGHKLNLFTYYGLSSNNSSVRIAKLKDKLKTLNENTNGLLPLEGAVPFNGVYRNISSQTLKKFEAFTTEKISNMDNRIIFPIYDIRKKVVAYIARDTSGTREYKYRYMTYPTHCKLTVYPTILEDRFHSIILVEGVFDLLNLYDKGIKNVVCTFGTDGLLNNTAEKLLPFRAAGIVKIFIMYDGDEPGQVAANKLTPLVEEAGFIVENIELPEDTDPGDLDQEMVNKIMKEINESSYSRQTTK